MTERSEGDEPTEGLPRPYIPESPPSAPASPPPPPPPLPGQYGPDGAPPPPPGPYPPVYPPPPYAPGQYPPNQYPPNQYPPGQYPAGSNLPSPSAPAWGSDQYPAMPYQPGVRYDGGTDGMAIASLVCGIVGYVTCGPLVHIPGVILGHMSRRRIAESNGRLGGSGMATAGLVLSYVGLALVAAYFLVVFIVLGAGAVMIELITTDGIFALDGGEWEVTNNIWLVGDDREVVVIDAAHDASAIAEAVNGRRVEAIVLTHGHNDHINAAVDLQDRVDAPIHLHPDDLMLWSVVYPDRAPDRGLAEGDVLRAGGVELGVLHTPGHSPGCCCLHSSVAGPNGAPILFSGDTLFCGGPGATGRSFSDFPTIIESIRGRLLALPPETVVHTGHGESTTIGDEAPHLQDWIDRGH